jgi:hypothetical protein
MNPDEFRALEVQSFKKAKDELPPPGRLSDATIKRIEDAFESGWGAGRDFEYEYGHEDPESGADRPYMRASDDQLEEEVEQEIKEDIKADVVEALDPEKFMSDLRERIPWYAKVAGFGAPLDLSLLNPDTIEGRVVLNAFKAVLEEREQEIGG